MEKAPVSEKDFRKRLEAQLKKPKRLKVGTETIGVVDLAPPKSIAGRKITHNPFPVFVAPGWLGIPQDYKALIGSLSLAGYRTLSVDTLTGIRYQKILTNIPTDFINFPKAELRKVAAMLAVLDVKGIEKTDVVAHSEGAIYVAMAAVLYPERFRNLVFIAPAGLLKLRKKNESKLRAVFDFAEHYLEYTKSVKEYVKNNPPERTVEVTFSRIMRILASSEKMIEDAFVQAEYSIDTLMERLDAIGIKISVVLGTDDTLYPLKRLLGAGKQKGTITASMVERIYRVPGEHTEIIDTPTKSVRAVERALAAMGKK